jgi:hypothetical protein
MHARHAVSRFRLGCLSLLLAGLLSGCGGTAKDTGPKSENDPKATTRRKDMENFMKNQPPGGTRKP